VAHRHATVEDDDKNHKIEKITTIPVHKNAGCCVAPIDRPVQTRDDQQNSRP
jgi:hypothetical protein